MDEQEENRNATITTIVCGILFFLFIFLSPLTGNDSDSAIMRVFAGFVVGFWIARMYASTLIAKAREQVKSDYSYYENSYNYYLKGKLKSYIIKYTAEENGKLLITDEEGMDKEEAIFKFNAFKDSVAWKDAKIVEILEGKLSAEYIKNFHKENRII